MNTLTLLEKAANRLITKARVRNLFPESRFRSALNEMVNLLESMGFEIEFCWNNEVTKITKVILTFEGETVERMVKENLKSL